MDGLERFVRRNGSICTAVIRYLKHTEIEKEKWDEAISNSETPSLYAQAWYLDAASPNWEALVKGEYEAVMPLTCSKKLGYHYLYQPFFTQQLGVFSSKGNSSDEVDLFLEALPEKYKLVEISLNEKNHKEIQGFEVKKMANYELDLAKPYEELRSGFSENNRRNVKKGQKAALVSTKITTSVDGVIDIFKEGRGAGLKNLKPAFYAELKRVFKAVVEQEKGEAWVVWKGFPPKPVAGAFMARHNNRHYFLFSGTSAEGKKCGAMPYLINTYIEDHSGTEGVLDFEGSNNANLARFYRGFGAKLSVYLYITRNRLPAFVKWIKG